MASLSGLLGTQFQGLQGLQGLQGTQGTQGLQGLQGLQGTQGTQGLQGLQGLSNQGTQGSFLTNLPQSTNTTIVSTDAGKHLNINANVTINDSTSFSIGDMCTIYNSGTTIRTISIPNGSVTELRLAGTASTGTRYLSQKGLGNIICVASDDYVISGAGLT
jgi:hypothetical protein